MNQNEPKSMEYYESIKKMKKKVNSSTLRMGSRIEIYLNVNKKNKNDEQIDCSKTNLFKK